MRFSKISFEQFNKDFEPYVGGVLPYQNVYESIKLPQRATAGSAGYDIYSPLNYDVFIPYKESYLFPTGIKVFLDDDKYLAIYPRSGLGFKYKLQLWNTVGIIDSDYVNSDNEGHIWVKVYNDSPERKTIKIPSGSAMCQGVITQYFTVEDDNVTTKRNGGFGSTDKK